MLPDANGLDLFREMRALNLSAPVPVIMLTARGDPMDRVVEYFEIGAKNYIQKPFEPRELLGPHPCRAAPGALAASADILRFGLLEIDRGARQVRGERRRQGADELSIRPARRGRRSRADRVLSREQLAELARDTMGPWVRAWIGSVDIPVSAASARQSEEDAKHPRHIITVRAQAAYSQRGPADAAAFLRIYLAVLGSLALFAVLVA